MITVEVFPTIQLIDCSFERGKKGPFCQIQATENMQFEITILWPLTVWARNLNFLELISFRSYFIPLFLCFTLFAF